MYKLHVLIAMNLAFPCLSATYIPAFYQQIAKQENVDAKLLYTIALNNSGKTNNHGVYQTHNWQVSVNEHLYVFGNQQTMYQFLLQLEDGVNINVGATLLPAITDKHKNWSYTDVSYTLKQTAKQLHQLNCTHEIQCVTNYVNNQTKQVAPKPFRNEPNQSLFELVGLIARKHNVEPALVHAVIVAESRYQIDAVSHAGAIGLMQVMPSTAQTLGVSADVLGEPQINIDTGVRYLKEQLDTFGSIELAVAAYNAGPGAVRKYKRTVPPYRETQAYVPKVLSYYRFFKRALG